MEKDNSNNYISLQEATKYCNYTQEYLSLRARQGKLKALKFGRNWITKKEWLDEYLKKVEEYNNHLNNLEKKKSFLSVAAPPKTVAPPANLPITSKFKFIPTPILILAAAVLLITGITFSKESFNPVKDFVVNNVKEISADVSNEVKNVLTNISPLAQEFEENFNKGLSQQIGNWKLEIGNLAQRANDNTYIIGATTDEIINAAGKVVSSLISSSADSFISLSSAIQDFYGGTSEGLAELRDKISDFGYSIRKAITYGVKEKISVVSDIGRSTAIAIDSFARAVSISKNQLHERSEGLRRDLSLRLHEQSEGLRRDLSLLRRDLSLRLADVGGLFKEYGQWVAQNYFAVNDFVEEKISQGYKAITKLWQVPGKIVEEKLLPKPSEEGLVVIPSTEKDEEVVKKIKESFSDEIKVEPKDETSGIIIPVFREKEGEKYLYILVPVKN